MEVAQDLWTDIKELFSIANGPCIQQLKAELAECKQKGILYKQIVGSLMYLTATRPDIMYSVSLISRYMENPTEIYLLAAKRILRYLQGTREFGLFYKKGEKSNLLGFTDSDYVGDQDDRKSTSGFLFMLGTSVVSWFSKKQPFVTLSSTEAEFVAATACACQGIWLRRILEELKFQQHGLLGYFVTIIQQSNFQRIQYYMEEANTLMSRSIF
ncbi:uncharacterized protein LOC109802019 [Cajanus cajan]|nr:uncharacterized protein LOC109802019 [Cajanus cajan]